MLRSIDLADIVKTINAEAAQSHNVPDNFLDCCENKDRSISVWLREPVTGKKSKMAFKYAVKGRKGSRYISLAVRNKIMSLFDPPASAEIKNIASDEDYTYLIFLEWEDDIASYMKKVLIYFIENFEPSDKFGCCGKYIECSKKGVCIHNNKFYAKACWYRKNLEAGKVFF